MAENLSTEYQARIYDNNHGYFVEVKPDSDGLNLCEIRYDEGNKEARDSSIIISWDMAEAMAKAILELKPKNETEESQ